MNKKITYNTTEKINNEISSCKWIGYDIQLLDAKSRNRKKKRASWQRIYSILFSSKTKTVVELLSRTISKHTNSVCLLKLLNSVCLLKLLVFLKKKRKEKPTKSNGDKSELIIPKKARILNGDYERDMFWELPLFKVQKTTSRSIPSMKNIYIIFSRVRPDVQFNYSHTSLQSFYNWNVAAITAELVPSQVRIMACIYVIVGQGSGHILVNLKIKISCHNLLKEKEHMMSKNRIPVRR